MGFVCVCGKEFASQKSLSAHMASCKDYYLKRDGNLDAYNTRHNNLSSAMKLVAVNLSTIFRDRAADKKKKELDTWVSEQHTCEKCGKVMTEKFGSGRFCSRVCANSHIQTEEANQKRRNKLSKEYFCSLCGKKLPKKNKYGYCMECYHKVVPYPESAKEKQRLLMLGKSRWNIHRDQSSYAEKFFEQVLINNDIPYKKEYQVKREDDYHCYYLDFLLPNNIDLEIDGSQHSYRADQDFIRDEYLKFKGYIVYRVKWNSINSDKGSDEMKLKISKFLDFYNSLATD